MLCLVWGLPFFNLFWKKPILIYIYVYLTMYCLMVISGLHRESKIDGLLHELEELKKDLGEVSTEEKTVTKPDYDDEEFTKRKRHF